MICVIHYVSFFTKIFEFSIKILYFHSNINQTSQKKNLIKFSHTKYILFFFISSNILNYLFFFLNIFVTKTKQTITMSGIYKLNSYLIISNCKYFVCCFVKNLCSLLFFQPHLTFRNKPT